MLKRTIGMPKRATALATLGALVLMLASGCVDEQARKDLDAATNKNQELAAQVTELQAQIKGLQKNVNYDEVIENKVNAKMAAMEEASRKKGEADTQSITDFVTNSKKSIEDMNEAMHAQIGDRDKAGVIEDHLQNRIVAQAELEKVEREKMKEEILRYIDSQLKDIYPFAFKKQKVNEPRKVSDQVDMP